jgi:hypothetical protein
MPLTVEDGTLIENPNSYVSLDEADAYCIPRNLWTADAAPEAKEAALMRAFDYLNTLQWLGQPLDWQSVQAWPRKGVPVPGNSAQIVPDDIVPRAVCQAQMELAALIYGGLNPFAPLERGGRVISESHSTTEGSVDVIGGDSKSDSYTYSEAAPVEIYFPAVSGLLSPYLAVVPGQGVKSTCLEVGRG